MRRRKKIITKKYDTKLLVITLVLTATGLVILADASAPIALREFSDKYFFVKQQALWAVAGLIFFIGTSVLNYKVWEKFATSFFIASLIGLLLVFVPGLGVKYLGAKRWIFLGNLSIQPSEILKLSLSVYFAKLASKKMKAAAYFIPLIVVFLLLMLQPDLGTAIVIAGIGMAQIFLAGVSIFYFLGAMLVGVLGVVVLILTSSYRKDRLLTFFEQTRDPLGKSYHIRQILIALGSGGIFGVGFGNSRQKYLYLPETATDSIFAVIAEELGFVGSFFIILAYIYFVWRGINVIKNAPDIFSKILASGIVTWIGGQALLNIGSMVAIIPLTGIPLPFISYGGSSLVAVLIGCGILLNISRYGKEA